MTIDEYLVDVTRKASNYTRSTEVWDRTEFKKALRDITERRGVLGCVLGGHSTGKSLVFRDLVRSINTPTSSQVIYVDLSLRINVLDGLLWELEGLRGQGIKDYVETLLDVKRSGYKVDKDSSIRVNLHRLYPNASRAQKLSIVLQGISAVSAGRPITLIIDKADLAFRKGAALDDGDDHPLYALKTFVGYTKQLNAVSSPYIIVLLHANVKLTPLSTDEHTACVK